MRAVVQRVLEASVCVDGDTISQIGPGLLVLVAAGKGDGSSDIQYLANKLSGLRVFQDQDGRMNRSLAEQDGEMLLVSQFTLYGDVRKGNRPSFEDAELPAAASALLDSLVIELQRKGIQVQTGRFRAQMKVHLINDGPVTILLDSRKLF